MIVGSIQMLLGGSAANYWFGIFTATGGSSRFYNVYPLGADLITVGDSPGGPSVFSITNSAVVNWATASFPTTTDTGGSFEGLFVSSSNIIYAAGRSSGNLNNNDMLLGTLTSSGAVTSLRKAARTAGTEEFLNALASNGTDLYVTGMHGFSNGGPASERDMYVGKYNTAGTIQWENKIGHSSTQDFGSAIGLDSSSNVYAVGQTNNGGSFSAGFIVKYNSSGSLQWQKILSDSSAYTVFSGITVSSTGDSYVVGGRLSNNPIIVKYNSSGSLSFQRQLLISSPSYGSFQEPFLAADGFVYVIGYAQGPVYEIGLIAKYNTSGTLQFQRTIAHSSRNVDLYNLYVTVEGIMYLAGEIGSDAFMTALPSDGSLTGTYGAYTYAASSYTDQTTSSTDSASSFSSSSVSLTYSTPAATTTSQTVTVTKQIV